jgi:GntR family transcriptional regulator
MKVKLNNKASIPIYYQIYEQIKHLIAIKEMNEGVKMPTIRELAIELEINPNTVAKAYTELLREGFIKTEQGVGTFVGNPKQTLTSKDREMKLKEIVTAFLDETFKYGFTKDEIIQYINNQK